MWEEFKGGIGMCDVCENETDLCYDRDWHGDVSIFIRGNKLFIYRSNSYGYENELDEINYCPMCGRRLGDD